MIGVFNSFNFIVNRDNNSCLAMCKEANIPISSLEYGRNIKQCRKPVKSYMDVIYSSFGKPSYILNDVCDGPVDCWVISSVHKNNIIYIEYWRGSFPERMYIFINIINSVTSSFVKSLYESVK